jgi:hypothetical protein
MRHPLVRIFALASGKISLSNSTSPYRLRRFFSAVCMLSLLLSAAGFAVRADAGDGSTTVRSVRLSNVVGSVQILNGTETQFTQAYPNMPLTQGAKVQTGEDGRVEIQFEDGSVVRVTPNSSTELSVLSRNSDGNTNTEVDLLTGLSYVEMSGAANQCFVVRFAGSEAISPAPVKFRVSLDANPATFAVLDGSVHLTKGNNYAIDVKMGETVSLDSNDSNRYFLAEGVDPDSWDQWNSDRDQALNQMAAQETQGARLNGNPNDAAWNDLDYYGNWYGGADGSQYWVPDGAGAGWDPYGLGAWGYYGGIGGYSWISGYPWGWYPYRCGNWMYLNNSAYASVGYTGWAWSPVNCGNTWYPGGRILSAPSKYHHPRPPVGHLPVHGPVVIPVDRGIDATKLNFRITPAPRTVVINGHAATVVPKTVNPSSTYANKTVAANGTPAGRTVYSAPHGQSFSSVPAYRPSAPSGSSYHGSPSAFAPSSGGGAHYSAPVSSAGASSAGAHMSAPASSGGSAGGSSGGGHTK